MCSSHPGLEGEQDFGQEEDEALEADGEILEDEVGDADGPDQVEEVKAVEVGLGKHQAGRNRDRGFTDSSAVSSLTGERRATQRQTWNRMWKQNREINTKYSQDKNRNAP